MRESKPFKTWHLILIILVIVISFGYKIYGSLWTKATIKIGGRETRVLVADTYHHRLKGWSGRKDMGKFGGMLFVFPDRGQHNMVMRDMHFSLDIVWLDGMKIVDIARSLPPEPGIAEGQLTIYRARTVSTLVLELPAGFKDQTDLKIGDKVEIIYK
ncbi:MAG: DUF192 domain-containing protein [Patescibacteria group bacterium]